MADRNPDGTFTKGSEAAKQAGHLGGLHAHGETDPKLEHQPGRNPDGTFLKGSEAAKEAGHLGGLHAHHKVDEKLEHNEHVAGRNPDGTFTKGSEAAKEAGHLGGLHAHHLTGVNELEVQTNVSDSLLAGEGFMKANTDDLGRFRPQR